MKSSANDVRRERTGGRRGAVRRRGPRVRRRRSLSWVGVAAGAVALVAALAGAALHGLVPDVAPAPLWGLAWSVDALGADARVATALGERLNLATALLAVVALVGVFTVLLLLVGERETRRPSLAVRWALGGGPRRLATHLLTGDGRRAAVLLGLGVVGGVVAAAVLRATWPGAGIVGARPAPIPVGLLVAVTSGAVVTVVAVVGVGILAPLPGLARRAPELLRRGRGVTDDPRAGTVRRGAATLQVGLSFAFAVTGVALVWGTPSAPGLSDGPELPGPVARYAVDDPAAWAGDPAGGGESRSGSAEDAPAEGSDPRPLLASPGTWVGVGVRDLLTVECGACVRGVFYLPVYGVDSTVHAVTPGVLKALGARLVEGRGFGPTDGPGAEPVALVNEAFRRHFEDGEAVGRRVRLSGGGERWVGVVGVVSDPVFRGPGAPGADEPVLWLPLAQHPASRVEGYLPGGTLPGLRALSGPRSLAELRRAAVAPVSWSGWILALSGAVALALALVSSAEVARVEARGRARAAAVRLALGAPPRRPAAGLLFRSLSGGVLGVLLGLAVGWALGAALGVGGSVGAALHGGLAVAVLGATVIGALPRVRALLRLQPAVLLREE